MPAAGCGRRSPAACRTGFREARMRDPIRSDEHPHDEAEALLPWYATGQLNAADGARVESHLAACARCQRQLSLERRMMSEFQALSPEFDAGWNRLRSRI